MNRLGDGTVSDTGEFMIELPPTLRLTHEDMQDPAIAAEVAEFRAAYPDGEVIVSDDAACPHCAAQGIRIDEHGQILDATTGGIVSLTPGAYVSYGKRPPPPRDRRKTARKAQRASRRKNR